MGVVLSIIHGKKLLYSYISQLVTDFHSLIALFTFHPEGFGYIILNLVDNKPHFFIIPWVEQQFLFGRGEKSKIQKTLV